MNNRRKHAASILDGFRVIKNRLMVARPLLRSGEVTDAQRAVLLFVCQHESTNVKALSQAFQTSSSAATQLTDALVKRGLLIRKVSSSDRRAVALTLSPKAHKRIAAMRAEGVDAMLTVFGALSDSELAAYAALTAKVSEALITD